MRRRTAVRWENWDQAGGLRTTGSPLAPITFPASPLTVRVEIALGADPAADPATWSWLDITAWVRYKPGIQITVGRRDESSRVEASQARLTLDNRDGRWSRRNPYGPYFGLLSKNTPIRIGVDPGDGVHYRYHGFVNEWPTRWTDKSATDTTVPIVCGGVLRRMQQGVRIKSALGRSMSGLNEGDIVPSYYVPMEDGRDATALASGLTGVTGATFSGNLSLASDSTLDGSYPLPTLSAGGRIRGTVPTYPTTSLWWVQFAINIHTKPSSTRTFLTLNVPGSGSSVERIVFYIDVTTFPGQSWLLVDAVTSTGTVVATTSLGLTGDSITPPDSAFYDAWQSIIIGQWDPAGSDYFLVSGMDNGDRVFDGLGTSSATGTAGKLTGFSFGHDSAETFSVGHFGLFTSNPNGLSDIFDNATLNARGMDGHTGEMAHVRAIRLCREEGVSLYCTSATSALMGPQASGTLLDNLRACEAADGGVLYEHEHGLGYQSLDDRLNAPVQLALDFDQRHVADTPEPADDDQRFTDRVTVTRSGGSSATVEDEDLIATAGVFETSASLNLYTDDQTADAAGWRLHMGTVDEDRWPAIPIRLHGTPDLIGPWTALPYGARMTLANPPDEMAPDTIDAVVEGWTERITPHTWDASLNTAPASPYMVGKLAADSGDTDPLLGWLEADSCTLAADVDTSATSWQITASPLWTTDSDDFPVDVRIGGEVVTVSACSGASAPQTWTIFARSVNGVVKAHSANDAIELVHPIVLVP